MPRWKRFLFYSVYLIVSVLGILLFMELSLAVAHAITDDHRLGTLKGSTPGDLPEDVLKIALFGGSSAAAYNTVVGTEVALKGQLREGYPGLKFHITNFARNGASFHGHQAEIMKSVIDDYDVFLIYAGHNEATNYLRGICYRRDPALTCEKYLPYQPAKSGPIEWIRTHSRIIAITSKINTKYIEPHVPSGDSADVALYRPPRPQLFEPEKAVPPWVRKAIDDNFEADLRELAELAEKKGKTIIIFSVPSHDGYMPSFSTHRDGLAVEELNAFDDTYRRGLDKFERGDFEGAIEDFLIANNIDDQTSILNYMLGRSYLNLGDASRGRQYIRISIDNDGVLLRSPSSLHRISESVASEYSSVHYVDIVRQFEKALDNGVSIDDLFMDFQHPNAIGHIIIARNFLSAMSKLEPFKSFPLPAENLDPENLRQELSSYGAPPWVERRMSFYRARWHISLAQGFADPSALLNEATRHITDFYENTEKTPADEVLTILVRALIAAEGSDSDEAVKLANQAAKISPGDVQDFLSGRINLDGRDLTGDWNLRFRYYWLDYSTEENEFILMNKK